MLRLKLFLVVTPQNLFSDITQWRTAPNMKNCSFLIKTAFLQLKAPCILRHSVVTAMLNKMLSHHEGLSYHLSLTPKDSKH